MKKYIFFIVLLLLVSNACTKNFDKINTNTNKPEVVVPDLLLPPIIYNSVNVGVEGSIVSQHLAVRDWAVALGRYDWYSTPHWDYDNLRNVVNLMLAGERVGNDNFVGIGLIFKAYLFSRTTDCVGNLPYSEALKAKEGIYMPAYDKQEDVYKFLLADLENANDLLDVNGIPISGDILYQGDILKWKKFANSLHLRLLMRVSDKMPEAKVKIKTIVDQPNKYPVFESNADMAALTYLPDSPNRYPHYNSIGLKVGEVVMSKPLVDTLLKYQDPRIAVFSQPTDASLANSTLPKFEGVPCALTKEDAIAYNGGMNRQCRISTRYFNEPNTEKGFYMSYWELQFILAEAAQKNWISQSAEDFYNKGISASFEHYKIEAEAASYLQNPNVKFDGSKGLTQIGVQKWISFFVINGYEVYFDWRRTKIPFLYPGDGNLNGGVIPVRWKYPDSEQNLNSKSYENAIQVQGSDNTNTKMWLTK